MLKGEWIDEDIPHDSNWFQAILIKVAEPVEFIGPAIWSKSPKESDDGRTSPDES